MVEYFLGKFFLGKFYIIDLGVERKGKCGCGFDYCNSDLVFGSIGLGTLFLIIKLISWLCWKIRGLRVLT